MQTFLSLRCRVPGQLEDELPELFSGLPLLGTEVGAASGGTVELAVYFAASDAAVRRQVRDLLEAHGGGGFELGEQPAEDWLAAYRERVRAFAVGRSWWLDPQPAAPSPAPGGRRRLVMPPRMAFGSGSHESTRLALEALEEVELAAAEVLDVGTGSGVLALAAERAGAAEVVGLDNDPTAVWVAREIAQLQEWPVRTRLVIGSTDCVAGRCFDVIVCNMISEELAPLIGAVASLLSPAGVLVVSGLMAHEIGAMTAVLERSALAVRGVGSAGEWASLRAGWRP